MKGKTIMTSGESIILLAVLLSYIVIMLTIARLERLIENLHLPDMQRGLTTHEAVKPHTCPACAGFGHIMVTPTWQKKCKDCNGTGQV
jgi:hypothetical protein